MVMTREVETFRALVHSSHDMLGLRTYSTLLKVAMRPDAPYFIILLSLTPDGFTRQGERAATQWVKVNYATYAKCYFHDITTKFLLKHCITWVLDTEMKSYDVFNFIVQKTFLQSVEPP